MRNPIPTDRPNPIRLWDEDAEFIALAREAGANTTLSPWRLFILAQFARQVVALPGEAAEVGVYKGGSGRLISRLLPEKPVHLFDTFTGMPPTNPLEDHHLAGDFSDTSLPAVTAYLADCPNVSLHPGLFPVSAPNGFDARRFCFVHIDVDIHQSILDCCEFFHPRMVPGGILVFDDYGFLTCPGARTAVDRFFKGTPEKPIYLPTGQAIAVRH